MKVYRVVIPVSRIEQGAQFYARVLQQAGLRVSPGRHYFDCEGTILSILDPEADGESYRAEPNPEHLYLAVDDLDEVWKRVRASGCGRCDAEIHTWPWGERSFYAVDPFGNPLCFVDRRTLFTGGPTH